MKVAYLNYFQEKGGAAVAAQRLAKYLKQEVDLTEIYGDNLEKSFSDKLDKLWHLPFKEKNVLWSNGRSTHPSIDVQKLNRDFDIIHLHWINNGLVSITDLNKIEKPILWTLHDLWPVTGGCHIPGSCSELQNFCQQCPKMSYKSFFNLAKSNNKMKREFLINKNIHFSVPSQYLQNIINQLNILPPERIHLVHNGIDESQFEIVNSEKKGGVQKILFGAMSATTDLNKGFDLFLEALNKIRTSAENLEIHIFGNDEPISIPNYQVISHGYVTQEELRELYRDADVTIVPSRYESFCQVALESLLKGTPVLCFDASGTKDIVVHMKTGYLAKGFDTKDLANGLDTLLEKVRHSQIDIDIQKLKSKFSIRKTGKQILEIYQELLRSSK